MNDIENLKDELYELLDKAEEIQFNIDNNTPELFFNYNEDEEQYEDWQRRAKFALMKTKQSIRRVRAKIKDIETREEKGRREAEAQEKRDRALRHQEATERAAQAKIDAAKIQSERQDEFNECFVTITKERLDRDLYLEIARAANEIVGD